MLYGCLTLEELMFLIRPYCVIYSDFYSDEQILYLKQFANVRISAPTTIVGTFYAYINTSEFATKVGLREDFQSRFPEQYANMKLSKVREYIENILKPKVKEMMEKEFGS